MLSLLWQKLAAHKVDLIGRPLPKGVTVEFASRLVQGIEFRAPQPVKATKSHVSGEFGFWRFICKRLRGRLDGTPKRAEPLVGIGHAGPNNAHRTPVGKESNPCGGQTQGCKRPAG